MKSKSCIEDHIMETNATDTTDHSGCVLSNDRANDYAAVVDTAEGPMHTTYSTDRALAAS